MMLTAKVSKERKHSVVEGDRSGQAAGLPQAPDGCTNDSASG